MSHTTAINSVEIKDIAALQSAIGELKANGISCDLLENQLPRAYYSGQAGLDKPADYVLKLHNSRYDVGFYKNGTGTYEPRCDLWGGDISKQIGVAPESPAKAAQAGIGKLLNLYSVHAVTRQATRQGYRVQRTTQDDGSVQLRVAV